MMEAAFPYLAAVAVAVVFLIVRTRARRRHEARMRDLTARMEATNDAR